MQPSKCQARKSCALLADFNFSTAEVNPREPQKSQNCQKLFETSWHYQCLVSKVKSSPSPSAIWIGKLTSFPKHWRMAEMLTFLGCKPAGISATNVQMTAFRPEREHSFPTENIVTMQSAIHPKNQNHAQMFLLRPATSNAAPPMAPEIILLAVVPSFQVYPNSKCQPGSKQSGSLWQESNN